MSFRIPAGGGGGGSTAADISFAPAGTITSITVQGAIPEAYSDAVAAAATDATTKANAAIAAAIAAAATDATTKANAAQAAAIAADIVLTASSSDPGGADGTSCLDTSV